MRKANPAFFYKKEITMRSREELLKEKNNLIQEVTFGIKKAKFNGKSVEELDVVAGRCLTLMAAFNKVGEIADVLEVEYKAYYPVCNIINQHNLAKKRDKNFDQFNFFSKHKEQSLSDSVFKDLSPINNSSQP